MIKLYVTNTMVYKCEIDKKEFKSEELLIAHMLKEHTNKGKEDEALKIREEIELLVGETKVDGLNLEVDVRELAIGNKDGKSKGYAYEVKVKYSVEGIIACIEEIFTISKREDNLDNLDNLGNLGNQSKEESIRDYKKGLKKFIEGLVRGVRGIQEVAGVEEVTVDKYRDIYEVKVRQKGLKEERIKRVGRDVINLEEELTRLTEEIKILSKDKVDRVGVEIESLPIYNCEDYIEEVRIKGTGLSIGEYLYNKGAKKVTIIIDEKE